MAKTLKQLMSESLPSLTAQKRLQYKTNQREVRRLFRLLNEEVFYDKLVMPKIYVKARLRGAWGICEGDDIPFVKGKSRCEIYLSDKWYCKQWLITTLAHEMVHQYQWDVYSQIREARGKESLMSHGPSFYVFRSRLKKYGIPLKEKFDSEEWFKTQNVFKC
jgi:hypothetical protein